MGGNGPGSCPVIASGSNGVQTLGPATVAQNVLAEANISSVLV
jgi:hypothetical protein